MVGQRRRLRRRRAPARRLAPILALLGICAIVVVLAVATVSQIAPASRSYRRTVDSGYAALVAPLVEQSNSVASYLTAVLKRGPGLQRSTFFSDLDTLASSSKALAVQYDAISPPSPAAWAAERCARTFDGRAIASAELRGALEGLLGGSTGTAKAAGDEASAGAAMTSAGRDLESDDALWAACRSGLRRAPGAARLAASRWVAPSSWTPAAVTAFVAAITASPTLAAVARMSVLNSVVTPSPLQAASGQVLVPPTTELEVQADVVNQGNVDLTGVKVAASLTGSGVRSGTGAIAGSPAVVSARRTLDIDAGTSEAVDLPRLSVSPGVSYALQVAATSRGSRAPAALDNLVLVVDTALSQTTVLSSISPVQVGRTVTYTANISTSLSGVPRASGTVEFQDDSSTIPTCSAQTLSSGRATCSVSYPSAGTHVITALYSGDPSRSASTSAPVIEVVVPAASRSHRSTTKTSTARSA